MMHMKAAAMTALSLLAGCAAIPAAKTATASGLSRLTAVGTVDERFLSYNVEMVEVTGGRFWRPYGSPGADRYEYRPPLDLTDARLRGLAAALGPSYVRVSGTWANATWFSDGDAAPAKAPAGFDTVLTRPQWRGVIDFVKAVDGRIVTSFATSPGARDAAGAWRPDTAARWMAFTKAAGGEIAATEFANEPNMLWLTQPPAGYTGEAYRRDYATFAAWLRNASPKTKLLAPGVAELGEPTRTLARSDASRHILEVEQLITADSPRPDGFSYHYYGSGSQRCGPAARTGLTLDKAIDPAWLDGVDATISRVAAARDRTAPGAPLWNTESAESSCGGSPWAATFADSFRFVDTLGRSARAGVRVYIHNTLSASDYALLDAEDATPRPNYWAAVLWKRTMGTTVLAAPASPAPTLRIYAHCLAGRPGGVALAAINLGDAAQTIPVGGRGRSWVMQATDRLDTKAITISGITPGADAKGALSGLEGTPAAGSLAIPAKAIAFVAVEDARNPACR